MGKTNANSENDAFAEGMQLACSSILPVALRSAVELGLFDIIAASEPKFLSAKEIASQISTIGVDATVMVERILRFLASSSVLKCEVTKRPDGDEYLSYGLSPVCKYLVREKDGVCVAPFLLVLQDKVAVSAGYHIKDAVVDGGDPFKKAHGMTAYEYLAQDYRFSDVFNQAMHGVTTLTMSKMFEVYKGFEGLKQIVDVGGGTGANLVAIISRYPHIKGVNFDLPHVIKDAPPYEGVEHVTGDMFERVPRGEVILLKDVLHNWSDDECVKLLKNCWTALPKSGKVIVIDALLPQYPHTDVISNNTFCYDLIMLRMGSGANERTEREFDVLARKAGFARTKVICNAHIKYLIEFYKI